jgi:DNA-binding MarR family transcriptional regulator
MDLQDIRTLKILEKVERDSTSSQRDLARELNISLGLVNSFVKRLTQKGYFKIKQIPKNRIRYILTPRGFTEKSRLTLEYIQHSYQFYKNIRKKMRDLYVDLEQQGVRRIVFYGVGEMAEIAFVALHETEIELTAVVDDGKIGRRFMSLVVLSPLQLSSLKFDRIFITTIRPQETIEQKIVDLGIAPVKIVQIQ